MVYLAVLAGTILGSLGDPIFIIGIFAAAVIGLSRSGALPLAAGAVAFALARTLISMHNRSQFGLDPTVNVFIPVSALVSFAVAWSVTRGLRKVFSRDL